MERVSVVKFRIPFEEGSMVVEIYNDDYVTIVVEECGQEMEVKTSVGPAQIESFDMFSWMNFMQNMSGVSIEQPVVDAPAQEIPLTEVDPCMGHLSPEAAMWSQMANTLRRATGMTKTVNNISLDRFPRRR